MHAVTYIECFATPGSHFIQWVWFRTIADCRVWAEEVGHAQQLRHCFADTAVA